MGGQGRGGMALAEALPDGFYSAGVGAGAFEGQGEVAVGLGVAGGCESVGWGQRVAGCPSGP